MLLHLLNNDRAILKKPMEREEVKRTGDRELRAKTTYQNSSLTLNILDSFFVAHLLISFFIFQESNQNMITFPLKN